MDVEPEDGREGLAKLTDPESTRVPVRPVPNLSDRRESGRGELPKPSAYITANQRRYIERLITDTETNVDALLEYFGLESLDEIPKGEASRVISALEQRRRAA
jgi:hypothetical protein